MTTAHDLMTEPLLRWRDRARRRGMTTLPGLLARLASGELADFPRLRTHQLQPWMMFLTQLAAIALRRAKRSDPLVDEAGWQKMLLALTGGNHEPWCLVVEDLAKPAFFQPPIPEASERGWSLEKGGWKWTDRPDDIDVLVLSKAHDVKTGRVRSDDLEQWAYALVAMQTMRGYAGVGHRPIARMKGGYGNRPTVGLSKDHTLHSRFLRDVSVLLETWPALEERGYRKDGVALVWLRPWSGDESLAISELSPHFIEVCERLRIVQNGAALRCHYTGASVSRCLAELKSGDVGDPWIPVQKDGGALTVGHRGFHYELLAHLLVGDTYELCDAQKPRAGDGDPLLLLGSALARGEGKTEGLHERTLIITGAIKRRLGQKDTRDALGKRATVHVERAKTMRRNVLFPALVQLKLADKVPEDRFDARVDEVFFDELFRTVEWDDATAQREWELKLEAMAREELSTAIERCCVPVARRYQAIAAAESVFAGCLRNQFPDLVAEPGDPKPRLEGVAP